MFECRYPLQIKEATSLFLNLQPTSCPRRTISVVPSRKPPPSRDFNQFHLFPQLPLEIRLIIWRETFPRQRQLILMNHIHGTMLRSTHPSGKEPSIRYQVVPPPFALQINHESRQEVLAHYHPLSTSCAVNQPPRSQEAILFNPKRDSIYLSWDECVKNPPPAVQCSEIFSPNMFYQNQILEKLGSAGLEKVETLVLGQSNESYDSLIDLSKPFPRYLQLFTGLRELRLARTRGSRSPVRFRQLQQYADSILRYFRTEHAINPEVRVPVVTLWEMNFDVDWHYWMNEGRPQYASDDVKGNWKPEPNHHFKLPPVDQYKYYPLLKDNDAPLAVVSKAAVDREPGYWD